MDAGGVFANVVVPLQQEIIGATLSPNFRYRLTMAGAGSGFDTLTGLVGPTDVLKTEFAGHTATAVEIVAVFGVVNDDSSAHPVIVGINAELSRILKLGLRGRPLRRPRRRRAVLSAQRTSNASLPPHLIHRQRPRPARAPAWLGRGSVHYSFAMERGHYCIRASNRMVRTGEISGLLGSTFRLLGYIFKRLLDTTLEK